MAKAEEVNTMDFIDEQDSMHGFEHISQETMALPFLRIIQKGSPQLDENSPKYIEGAKVGMFFNTASNDLYSKEVGLIVLKFERVFVEWKPNRGGLVGYHTPENAEQIAEDKTFGKWKTANGNLLQENYVYYCLIEGKEHEGPVVLSLYSTAIAEAKVWNRLLVTRVMDNGKKAMPYYLVWKADTVYMKNDQGDWYKVRIKFDHYINKDQYLQVAPARTALPDSRVDFAQLSEETSQNTQY